MTKLTPGQLGYAVLAAAAPGEATWTAQEHTGRIDLVMTDVIMPEKQPLRSTWPWAERGSRRLREPGG